MTSVAEAFLADIREHPTDHAPRLIYADWLEDNGDPARAEFIRLQIERNCLAPNDPRMRSLLHREGMLLNEHETTWRASLPQLDGVTWEDFTGGFVEAVFVENVSIFLQHAETLFSATPVRRLQIGSIDNATASSLVHSHWLARITELNLGNNPRLGAAGLAMLADSSWCMGLTALLLHNCALGDASIAALAGSANLQGLKELYLSGNDLGDEGARQLARAESLPALTDLDLRDNHIGDEGLTALAREQDRAALSTLYLVNNQIGPTGVSQLAFSGRLSGLCRLYLNYNPLGNEAALDLAVSDSLQGLLDLDLRNAEIRDTGGRALARSTAFPSLQMLCLGGNRMRLETLALLRSAYGERLRL